jgi:hypothetical protein
MILRTTAHLQANLIGACKMRIAHDFGSVRIVHLGSPFDHASDIVVETLEADGTWKRYAGFNSLSDDYAITNSRQAADRAVKMKAAEAAGAI